MVAPGFLTYKNAQCTLSGHWKKPLLGTTRWFSQNYKFERKTQRLTEAA